MLTKIYVINTYHGDVDLWEDMITLEDEMLIEGGFSTELSGETIYGEESLGSGHFISEDEIKRRIDEFPANSEEDINYYSAMYYAMQDVDINLHGAPFKVVEVDLDV